LIDLVCDMPNSTAFQTEMCMECIEWCKQEKRTFLRQRIEARLASLLLQMKVWDGGYRVCTFDQFL
jgi:26S proteasome regulatory subunit N6